MCIVQYIGGYLYHVLCILYKVLENACIMYYHVLLGIGGYSYHVLVLCVLYKVLENACMLGYKCTALIFLT